MLYVFEILAKKKQKLKFVFKLGTKCRKCQSSQRWKTSRDTKCHACYANEIGWTTEGQIGCFKWWGDQNDEGTHSDKNINLNRSAMFQY